MSIEQLLEAWKEFKFTETLKNLDSHSQVITTHQECNVEERAKLREESKNWAKSPADQKVKTVGNLIKLYQKEIDRLTKNEVFAETQLLSIWNELSKVADPVQIIEKAEKSNQVDSSEIIKLRIENDHLKKDVEAFKSEFQEIQNQEITIRKLQGTISDMKDNMAQLINESITKKEAMLKDEFNVQFESLKEQASEKERKYQQSKLEYEEIMAQNNILQRNAFEVKTKSDAALQAREAELELASTELYRMSEELNALKKALEKPEPIKTGRSVDKTELELQLVHKDIEITHLQKVNAENFEKETKYAETIDELQSKLLRQEVEITNLNLKIKEFPEKEHLQRLELKNKHLKEIIRQFGANESLLSSSDDESPNGKDEPKLNPAAVLLMKSRTLETDLMKSKATIEKMNTEMAALQERVDRYEEELEKKKKLTAQLEVDIDKLTSTLNSNKIFSGTKDENSLSGTGEPDVTNMMEMLSRQRDLYKDKIQQLDVTNSQLQGSLQNQLVEIKKLKSDNLQLYEKVKFLESYGGTGNKTTNLVESRYQTIYEESSNPFVEFNKKEKQKVYSNLNPVEKLLLTLSRFFLSTKFSRLTLFIYMAILHLLVFFSFMMWSHLV